MIPSSAPSVSALTTVSIDRVGGTGLYLHGRRLIAAWAVCTTLVMLTLVLFVASIPIYTAQLQTVGADATTCDSGRLTMTIMQALHDLGIPVGSYAIFNVAVIVVTMMGWLAVGGVIVWRKPHDWMVLLVAMMLITESVVGTSCLTSPLEHSFLVWRLLSHFLNFLGPVLFLLVFSLFPDGRFIPCWSRWLVVALSVTYVPPSFFPDWYFSDFLSDLFVFGVSLFLVITQLYRYLFVFDTMQRRQTRWVVFAVTAGLVVFIGWYMPPLIFPSIGLPDALHSLFGNPVFTFLMLLTPLGNPNPVFTFLTLIVPLSLGFAILRHHLWNIHIIMSRTLVYGMLTACIIGMYVLIVGGLGIAFQAQGNPITSLLATGIIAVLFQPLRDQLQQGVNRLIYGERNDPYAVLSHLGQRLEATLAPDAILPTIVETVAQALKLPYAAILLKQDEEFTLTASYGVATDAPLHLPLVYQGEIIGKLLLAPRTPHTSFSPVDLRLLNDLARQTGIAAHTVRLTRELHHSRERLVTRLEEERRRLRRDLHDGLGPQLASQTLTLTAARKLLRHDPDEAETLLTDAITHSQEAIADIRHLVYALRPPALTDLGLLAALREQVNQYRVSGIAITLDTPEYLPPLPAAIEVACYRVVQEALTNVVHHACAQTCSLRLSVDKMLSLEIADDGVGLPTPFRAGVGLASMCERAKELGGTCAIESASSGGTRVHMQLPLP